MVAERKIPVSPQRYRVKGLASYAGCVAKMSKIFRQSKNRNHDDNEGKLFSNSPLSPSSSATCENVLIILAICFLVEQSSSITDYRIMDTMKNGEQVSVSLVS